MSEQFPLQIAGTAPPPPDPMIVTIRIMRPSTECPKGYIGASSTYPPEPGETWRRGRDLADGHCTEETLLRISDDVRAIMEGFPRAYERDNTP